MTAPWLTPATGAAAAQVAALEAVLPRLTTPRLTLRPARLADYPVWAGIECSERAAFIGGPFTEEDAWLDFTQNVASWLLRGYGLWAAEERATGTLAGFGAHAVEYGDPEPEIGWLLTEEAEGRGYATEIGSALRNHHLDTLGQATVVSYVDPGNTASARVAGKLGATRDAVAEARFAALHGATVQVWRHARPEAV